MRRFRNWVRRWRHRLGFPEELKPPITDAEIDRIVDEHWAIIQKKWSLEQQAEFFNMLEHELGILHHGFGPMIRNHYGLWQHGWKPVIIDGCDHSERRRDQVSMRIIRELWKRGQRS